MKSQNNFETSPREALSDEEIHNAALALYPTPEFDSEGMYRESIIQNGEKVTTTRSAGTYWYEVALIEQRLKDVEVFSEELEEFIGITSELSKFFALGDSVDATEKLNAIEIAHSVSQGHSLLELADYWNKIKGDYLRDYPSDTIYKREILDVFKGLVNASRDGKLPESSICRKMLDLTLKSHALAYEFSDEFSSGVGVKIRQHMEGILFNNLDIESAGVAIGLLSRLKGNEADDAQVSAYVDAVMFFAFHHRLDSSVAENFDTYLKKAIFSRDPNVSILQRGGNIGAMERGYFGIGEFTTLLYAEPATPRYINKLMIVNSEIPTSVASKFEQNRKDALSLMVAFPSLKEAIHDQRQGNHLLIQAMVDYYSGKASDADLTSAAVAHSLLNENTVFLQTALEIENYEMIVKERTPEGTRDVKIIDLLRRLADNTRPVPEDAPQTKYGELNETLVEFDNSSEDVIDKETLRIALEQINLVLESLYKSNHVGIDSTLVTALSYLDRKAASAIRHLTFEQQVRAYREPWFHEVLKFHELTNNPTGYNLAELTKYISDVKKEHTEGAYKLIGNRTVHTMNTLRKIYKEEGYARWGEMLWSGNLSKELIGLADLREPTTAEGKRYKERFLGDPEERLKGD